MKKLQSILLSVFCIMNFSFQLCGQIITTVAGGVTGHGGYWGEGGLATNAELADCSWISIDARGNIYIGDLSRVLKVDAVSGIITTMVGTGVLGYNAEDIPATSAQLNWAEPTCFDHYGNLYIADAFNNRIRKVSPNDTISEFAGNGIVGSTGDGGPAIDAELFLGDSKWDVFGNFYMGDSLKIRKIDSFVNISTVVGTGVVGSILDGIPATAANIGMPTGLATDHYGNIYFSDSTASVRKVTISTGIINRVAGTGDGISGPYSGDGVPATACHIGPVGIYVDDTGNLYIADGGNDRIYMVDTADIIHTVAGIGTRGYSGDAGPATAAQLYAPHNIAFDACGNMYIGDHGNMVVRKVTFNPTCNDSALYSLNTKNAQVNASISIYPNPVYDELTINSNNKIAQVTISNLIGQVVASPQPSPRGEGGVAHVDVGGLSPGVYVVRVTDVDGSVVVRKVVKE